MTRAIWAVLFFSALAGAYPNGSRVPTGNAGEPGTGTPCASCHTVTLNPAGGSAKLTLSGGNTFTAGTAQRWTVTVTDSNSSRQKGFQLTATAGTFTAVSSTTVLTSASGKQYVTHTGSASSYSFDWTPPASGDSVTVYLAGAAANSTRQTDVYTATATLAKATAKPAIQSAGVVNAASYAAGISPGAWVTIFGTNLAAAGVARSWRSDEIVNGVLPTALEGTSVTIDGKAAAVAYVSETQLNVQAPDDSARGTVSVQVTTAGGTSDAASVDLAAAAPGLFRFTPQSNRYVAALHADGSLAGAADLYGTGTSLTPAKPGETVLLFGTGFGATNPAVAAGTLYSGAAPLADGNGLVIRIGGVTATVQFAGLSAAGLNQFNVVVPTLADGDYAVGATVWGTAVSTSQYLTVKQ
jgi:uncharacterized protein (TIGR03437 family)